MANRTERMDAILRKYFGDTAVIEVRDDSHKHADHVHLTIGKAAESGETHYVVSIQSDKFSGLTPVARHRLVNDLLKPEFDTGLHALTLQLSTK